jgi:hypothetical protein
MRAQVCACFLVFCFEFMYALLCCCTDSNLCVMRVGVGAMQHLQHTN